MVGQDPFGAVPEKTKDISTRDILFSYEGRINRQIWWLYGIIGLSIVGFIYGFIIGSIFGIIFPFNDFLWASGTAIFMLPFYYVVLAVDMKRLQDTGRSWEWGFLSVLSMIFGIIYLYTPYGSEEEFLVDNLSSLVYIPVWIICGFFKGTDGPNDFGPDPLQSQSVASQNSFDNTPGVYNSAPSNTVPVNTSELKELGELRDSGIITEVEFQIEKDKILGNR